MKMGDIIFWFFVVLNIILVAVKITVDNKDSARCGDNGGTWISSKCLGIEELK